nr:MAG TPA: hypothetical protein [Caudoviricetes sp.]
MLNKRFTTLIKFIIHIVGRDTLYTRGNRINV